MPRASAEARAGAALRVGGSRPAPPPQFPEAAAKLWREIVADKPLGWFDAGALPLLRLYCLTLARAEGVEALLLLTPPEDDAAADIEKRLIKLNGSCTTLATKLRLSVQAAVDRRSRMLDESGPGEEAASDPLLGGKVVRLRS
jgi:hypothetical protein